MTVLRATVVALSLLVFAAFAPAAEPQAKLVSAKPGDPPALEITGLAKDDLAALAGAKLTAEEWAALARVVVDDSTPAADKAAVAGDWSATATAVRFEPLFPLVPGRKYRAYFDLRAIPRATHKGGEFSVAVAVPKGVPGPRVQVLGVYPSANRLPENTLRLYIYFSGPVKRGGVYSRVKLVRDDGKEVERPFVELDEELWAPEGNRLTLIFDPGRVKRGLTPREEHGPILEEGRSFTFTIDASWPDAEGRPLLETYKKTFFVTAPDDEPVWPDQWKVIAPRAGSDSPLIVRLAKPLDHALLARKVWVTDAKGQRVEGTITVGGGERVVTFAPAKAWARGDYKLVVDEWLEDVCGNRVGEPFEVDVFRPIPTKPMAKLTERGFPVK